MPQHLIKRKDVEFDLKDGWYCETSLNKWPSGIKVIEGDLIYVAQNGYAIYGKGTVEKVKEPIVSKKTNKKSKSEILTSEIQLLKRREVRQSPRKRRASGVADSVICSV